MSPRSSEANAAIHDDRRMRILDAALGSFVEQGFEGTRMQQIAEKSGLSYGLVYHYFPSKDAVFAALVDSALEAAGRLVSMLPKDARPEDFAAFVERAVSGPSPHYFAMIIEALSKKGVEPELAGRARESVLELMRSLAASLGGREAGSPAEEDERKRWKAKGILAVLLGTSIMRLCGISAGTFASRAVASLVDTPPEQGSEA